MCTLRCFVLQHKISAAGPARGIVRLHLIWGTVNHQFLEAYLAIPVTLVPQWPRIPFPGGNGVARGRVLRVVQPGQPRTDLGHDVRELAFAQGRAPPPDQVGPGPTVG